MIKYNFRSATIANESESRKVCGYAVRFEEPSVVLWDKESEFVEIIHRGAITEETILNSDVMCLLNHRSDAVLARSNKGVGSMKLTLDDNGLMYEFEAPNTAIGDELLEHIRRGEISQSSFAFTYGYNEGDVVREFDANGRETRHVYRIGALYDCSPVYQPAYPSTSCAKRAIESLNSFHDDMENTDNQINNEKEIEALKSQIAELEAKLEEANRKEEETPEEKPSDTEKEAPETDEKPADEETIKEDEETRSEDEKEPKNDEEETSEDGSDEETINNNEETSETDENSDNEEETSDDEDKNENKRSFNIKMNTNMLTEQIRSAMNSADHKVILNAETRAVKVNGTDGVHDHTVETEMKGLLEPLYADSILSKIGMRMYTGVPMGDIQVPILGKAQVGFVGETSAPTSASTPNIGSVKLSPKRITGYVDYSLNFLAQDTLAVNEAIKRDLIKAVGDAWQAKIFSGDAKTDDAPAGLFAGKLEGENALQATTNFLGLTNLEATLEEANVNDIKYVLSPKAKAAFRNMAKSTKSTELVLQNNSIDGTDAISCSSVASKAFVVGDFSALVGAIWNDVELIVDPYTLATQGMVRIVVNAFVDHKVARPEAFAYGVVA